ncbi:uncharacterized protein PgNI_07584 [Pyricularia grisea]|uniref:Uncharacterized protein n=1 Tax=Pyricularia grisea TaxID=148305 RepID=A0A6P8B165_PYRGI|nr:uncharacterized protein PgNI_07584 [Pyricularia grisea]TLD08640.1 hypothetical protein PgNI_07584 [Pyricularia grisea]
MDVTVAYNQHSSHARRKNRSSTNLNHLSLAPLTTKLPLSDPEELPAIQTAPLVPSTSYLQGKSAPTTPRLLSHSPARSRSQSRRATGTASLPKSKSTTHLHRTSTSGTATPTAAGRRHRMEDANGGGPLSANEPNNSDWLLRAGAMLSGEYREYKGQAWLETRASSTNLVGTHSAALDAEEIAFEHKMAREYQHSSSRHHSRRGSVQILEDESIYMTATSSPPGSRLPSRSHSRVSSRTQLMTPRERRSMDGYFNGHHPQVDDDIPGPDFVNLDETLEAIEQDTSIEDEAHVRRLVKREKQDGAGAWFGNVLGWRLFSVDENDEETDEEDDEESYVAGESGGDASPYNLAVMERRRTNGLARFEGITTVPEARVPPPKADEGGWQDAAWLLSVASKVLL